MKRELTKNDYYTLKNIKEGTFGFTLMVIIFLISALISYLLNSFEWVFYSLLPAGIFFSFVVFLQAYKLLKYGRRS